MRERNAHDKPNATPWRTTFQVHVVAMCVACLVALTSTTLAEVDLQFHQELIAPGQPESVAFGDFDEDGKLDLAVLSNLPGGPNTVRIFLQAPDGEFSLTTEMSIPSLYRIQAVDLDADGHLDLIASGITSSFIWIASGDGALGFATQTLDIASFGARVDFGDLDNDGDLDLVFAGAFGTPGTGTVEIHLNDGANNFGTPQTITFAGSSSGVRLGDLNADGSLDAVVGGLQNVAVFLGNGDGTLQSPPETFATMNELTQSVAIADVNEDGFADVLAGSSSSGNGVSILYGDGTGSLSFPPTIVDTGFPVSDVLVVDFDLDGHVDFLTRSPCVDATIYTGDGTGAFEIAQSFANPWCPSGFAVADFTGDAVPDLAVTSTVDDLVILHASGFDPSNFVRGDVNQDSALDIADAIALLAALFVPGSSVDCVTAGDANDDDTVDIADAVSILLVLFGGAAPLPEPNTACGPDPTPGPLECVFFAGCP